MNKEEKAYMAEWFDRLEKELNEASRTLTASGHTGMAHAYLSRARHNISMAMSHVAAS